MSFGTIPLSPDDKPDGFVLLSMYEKLESENAKLRLMVWIMRECLADECKRCSEHGFPCDIDHDMQELGIRIYDLAAEDELGIEVE